MSAGELSGHVTGSTVDQGSGTASTADTNSILVQITVTLNKPKRAEDAANAIAAIIKRVTTSNYVRQSIAIYARSSPTTPPGSRRSSCGSRA